jgi:hypothetical protein
MSSNPSGGLRWHWRAWRRQAQWHETSRQIEDWLLAQTSMPTDTLVLIGASAGWMMSPRWLQRFAQIHTFDIDPWSEPLFRWRHGRHLKAHGVALYSHREDALASLPLLVQQHPQAMFWFDNLLGQLCLFHPGQSEPVERAIRQLRQTLAPVAWGSLHDRLSGPVQACSQILPPPAGAQASTSEDGLQDWLKTIHAISPWGDHLTADVFPQGTPLQRIAWPFRQDHWHCLEIGWCPPRKTVQI